MKRIRQILCGIVLLIIAVIICVVANGGNSTETKDATAALLFGPLGLYAIFTKRIIIE